MHKIFIFAAISVLFTSTALAQTSPRLPWQDPRVPPENRITDLLSRMSLDDKISVLNSNSTAPAIGFMGASQSEGLHGLAEGGPGHWEGKNQPIIPTTTFPQSHGLGQTWDPDLIRQMARVEAYEARYTYSRYHRLGLIIRSPNADLSRDPRWGRTEESFGEDPFLVGTMATAVTRGLQGDDPHYWMSVSLLKHFLANSNENGRDGSSSDFDERLFHEYYSVPFRMAIEEGHAGGMMASYNAWNGTPMTVNPVLREVVRKQWGFDGILCTDGGAMTNLVKFHRAFATLPQAAAATIKNSVSEFLDDYQQPVRDALKQGILTEHDIDDVLRGPYRIMLRLGLMDIPSQNPMARIGIDDVAKGDPWTWTENKALVRKVTDESIVLLKNDGGMLPLDAGKLESLAVIGPLADKVELDWYSGTPPYVVTPLAGIRARAGASVHVMYSDGKDEKAAATIAARADIAIVIVGNNPTCGAGWMICPTPSDGKEAVDRKTLTLEQESLVKAVLAVNPHTVAVLQVSFPYTTTWTQEHAPAILEMAHNSQEQGNGLADVLFGDYNPAGRLGQTWVRNMNQLPPMMDYNIRHGRMYMYLDSRPLYAFGFGLSYTSFSYKNLRLSGTEVSANGKLIATVDVKNTGLREGDEVVQLYIAHLNSKVERPRQELKAFRRVHLAAGETRAIELQVPIQSLAYWNTAARRFTVEADRIQVRVGGSSDSLPLKADATVSEQ
ncbi:glycoside hydrolase family 3 C-terminal domain-containing protein [Edaphobacter sp. HDX4]|uniref:glycoside hydrolase family 3 C-terminal domain-containing protein n=1 Tax=Edaphobacter sp. HDX4 TaxID=2794064 RepID=UPI002FE67213